MLFFFSWVEGEGTVMNTSIFSPQGLTVFITLAYGMGCCWHENQDV